VSVPTNTPYYVQAGWRVCKLETLDELDHLCVWAEPYFADVPVGTTTAVHARATTMIHWVCDRAEAKTSVGRYCDQCTKSIGESGAVSFVQYEIYKASLRIQAQDG
jgi:hypothetical protein